MKDAFIARFPVHKPSTKDPINRPDLWTVRGGSLTAWRGGGKGEGQRRRSFYEAAKIDFDFTLKLREEFYFFPIGCRSERLMGFRTSGPHIVAFLEWVHQQEPDAERFSDFTRTQLTQLLRRFEAQLPEEIRREAIDLKRLVSAGFDRDDELGFSQIGKRRWGNLKVPPERSDGLETYLRAPTKCLFLYSECDREFRHWFQENWKSLDRESGSLLHFFDYGQEEGIRSWGHGSLGRYTYAEHFIRGLNPIPGANVSKIRNAGLPCMLLWTDDDHLIIPFADVVNNPASATFRFRSILRTLDEIGQKSELTALREKMLSENVELGKQRIKTDAEVFISYSHADVSHARQIASSLRHEGLKVWFDESIRPGHNWLNAIWHAICDAKATIVLWSKSSIQSDYVKSEAEYARKRSALVPILLDEGLSIPPPFNTIQWIDFSNQPWPGSLGMAELTSTIRRSIERSKRN